MTQTTETQAQVQTTVKSPLELAVAKFKNAAVKLSKVETRAAEFDQAAAALNTEMAEVCTGQRAQTKDRTIMVIAKEQDAAVKKAAKIRKSGAVLVEDARNALAELTEITATLGAAYPVEVSDEDRADAADELAEGDEGSADELDNLQE